LAIACSISESNQRRVNQKPQRILLNPGQDASANNIFATQEQDEQKIEKSQFCKKVPDRLTHQEQSEEQNHPRIGGEEI
jgi:hypothetical protein